MELYNNNDDDPERELICTRYNIILKSIIKYNTYFIK